MGAVTEGTFDGFRATAARLRPFTEGWIRRTRAATRSAPRLLRWIAWFYSLWLLAAVLPFVAVAVSPLDRRVKGVVTLALVTAVLVMAVPSVNRAVAPRPERSPVPVITPGVQRPTAPVSVTPSSSSLPYQIARVDQVDSRGRSRWAVHAVITGGADQAAAVATLVEIARAQRQPHAVVVFAYRTSGEIGGGYTFGRAWLSTDGLGWSGDGKFDDGPDTGQIVGTVVTKLRASGVPETEERFVAPR